MTKRVTQPILTTRTAQEWGKFVLYEGCTMSRRMVGSRYATQFLLDKYGFDYVLLDKEKCCGSPVRRSGGGEEADALRDYNLDLVLKAGCDTMVTACPGCGSQLKSEEADHLGIKVYHFTEVLYDLAKNHELYLPDAMRPTKNLRITAHFPCHLHRGMKILCNILHETIIREFPNWEYIEMPDAEACCGAGGGVRASQKPLSFSIRERKLENINLIGADIVLAACPFCELQIDEGCRESETSKARGITPQSLIMMQFKDVATEVSKL